VPTVLCEGLANESVDCAMIETSGVAAKDISKI